MPNEKTDNSILSGVRCGGNGHNVGDDAAVVVSLREIPEKMCDGDAKRNQPKAFIGVQRGRDSYCDR